MICRSSFLSGPGWSLGMNGSITAHCSSESQNRFAIAISQAAKRQPGITKRQTSQRLGSVHTLGCRVRPKSETAPGTLPGHRKRRNMPSVDEHERCGMLFEERQNSDLLFEAADERWRAEVARRFGRIRCCDDAFVGEPSSYLRKAFDA